jgi:hypothetical protein
MIKAYGHITDDGALKINERSTFLKLLQPLKGREIELTIKKRSKKRSGDQNAYYWGVVVHLVSEALIDLGNEITPDEAHEFLKANFNYTEITNEQTGEVMKIPRSTSDLTTEEFTDYIEKVAKWAAEWLNITIPEPNEQTTLF